MCWMQFMKTATSFHLFEVSVWQNVYILPQIPHPPTAMIKSTKAQLPKKGNEITVIVATFP